MKSHALLRTNTGLTTNAKIVVSSSYSLFIDSIISIPELSSTKYKRREFNKTNYLDEIIPLFFKGTPADIAFSIKDEDDNKNMSLNFENQYDDLYEYGARNIIENKDYREEFEYFAPLHITKSSLPTKFIIFRIDGPGLINLNKGNFKQEIINKLKCVKIYDLTRNTPLGEWLELNITKNPNYPNSGLYIDFRKLEFSTWNGIDYEDGGYSERSLMLDSTLEIEQSFTDFERFVLNGYKNNKIIYPNIINFSFLFDDKPATPTSIRTWSLNRYTGFYLESLDFIKYVSPYILPAVKDDVIIDSNNILYSVSENEPFVESFKKNESFYIEIGGRFYKLEKFLEETDITVQRVKIGDNVFDELPSQNYVTRYKIISEISLEGKQNEINKNLILITSSNGQNKLTFSNGDTFNISEFDEADVWLIEIENKFHNIIKADDGEFYVNTDYAFSQSLEKFEYYINDPNPNDRKKIDLKVSETVSPKQFGIYRCKFTDIKDFDLDIVDTEYSKFEYIYKDRLTKTDETKFYSTNQDSESNPKELDDFKIGGEVANIPVSSEYLVNFELFRVENNDLNLLWKKNAQRLKWGFQNSLSSNDYPYLLNNSFVSEDYNRTVNPFSNEPKREDRNLDYFLTINPDNDTYLHHSLHVVDSAEASFSKVTQISNRAVFTNISDISYFGIFDVISISTDDGVVPSYNTTTRIEKIDFNGSWRIHTSIIFVSGNVNGKIKNLTRTPFSLNKYLNVGYDLDYFNYFFGKKTEFDSGNLIKNTQKFSYFNVGDANTPSITLFRGLKFKIWDVDGLQVSDDKVDLFNLSSSNNYDEYKFSILVSKNNYRLEKNSNIPNGATLSYASNTMRWAIVDEWKHDKIYTRNSLVRWNETIYQALTQSQIIEPEKLPSNSNDWSIYDKKNIFWNFIYDGTGASSTKNNMYELGQFIFNDSTVVIPPLVFNYKEYYYSSGTNGNNFWNPTQSYSLDDVVLYQDALWISTIDNNTTIPKTSSTYLTNGEYTSYWILATNSTSIWTSVEMWSPVSEYTEFNSQWNTSLFRAGHYVIYEDVVYSTVTTPAVGVAPPLDINWKRIYSLVQDTDFRYSDEFQKNNNPIIHMNNRYYLCSDNGLSEINETFDTLENGINIYINKKWKNVLINIYVNDNTYTLSELSGISTISNTKDYLSNTNRDNLYIDIYSKLTAKNFMDSINDLSNFYGFSDKIRYVIIENDLSIKLYDFNDLTTVNNLPVLITCEGPDEFLVKNNSLVVEKLSVPVSEVKPKRRLSGGVISNTEELNFYNDNSLAVAIRYDRYEILKVPNYSSLKNIIYNNLFRHSGDYSPIFHNIELFETQGLTGGGGNYKFDTSLTNFGKIKERIILKVNRQKNILKFKDKGNLQSIYPMIDEFGYHTISSFIFKSTWDYEFHVECQEVPQSRVDLVNQSIQPTQLTINNTNNSNLNLL